MSRTVSIGDVANIQRGTIDPRKQPEKHFELFSIPAFDNNRKPERLLGADIGSSKNVLPEQGVLFSKLNPRINRVWPFKGSSAVNRIASTEFVCLVPDEDNLDLEYLGWRLRVPGIAQQLPAGTAAATKSRERIKPRSLLELPILLPPLDEQRRIVAILNRAAKIERLKKQAQKRLREFILALFTKMFGDPSTNPMNWEVRALGDLCEMDRRTIKPDDPAASELQFVGVENVVSGTGALNFETHSRVGAQKSSAFRFDERHVLYGKLRPYLNKVATPDFAGRCSTELVPLLPRSGVNREFLAELLRQEKIVAFVKKSVTGSRMPRTDMISLLRLRVPLPSLDAQQQFAKLIAHTRTASQRGRTSSETARTLNASLMDTLLGAPT